MTAVDSLHKYYAGHYTLNDVDLIYMTFRDFVVHSSLGDCHTEFILIFLATIKIGPGTFLTFAKYNDY